MGVKNEAKTTAKLTNEMVKGLPLAATGKHYVYDTERRGFCVRVTPTGKFYAVRIKINGKEFQRSLCRVEETTAIAARNKAEVIIGELRQGLDRKAEARKEKQQQAEAVQAAKEEAERIAAGAFTISTALVTYLGKKKLKPRTIDDYNSIAEVELAEWVNKPLAEIDRDTAELKFKEITEDRGKTRAVQALKLCRMLCRDRKQGLQDWTKFFPKGNVRKTQLKHHDGKIIYSTLTGLTHDLAASKYVMALLLTGCRRGELASVLVSDVGLNCRTLTIRDPKNGKDHIIQCSTQLKAILEGLVVDGDGDKRPADAKLFGLCGDPRKTLKRINSAVQVEADQSAELNGTAVIDKQFSLHHLRKLCGITLNHLRFPHATIQAVLNHTPDAEDVTSRNYIEVDEEEKRCAWQAMSDYYAASLAKVIPIPTQQAAA